MRAADGSELGIAWVSEEDELRELLTKADAGTRAAFASAAAARPLDVAAAASAVQRVAVALATPAAASALSAPEASALRQAASHEVRLAP